MPESLVFSANVRLSPLGPIRLVASDGALVGADFTDGPERDRNPILEAAAAWLAAYFAGRPLPPAPPLAPTGTPFQRRVWSAICGIPYGQVRTYGAIARAVGVPRASRAVGGANRANPLVLFVPCHRVVAAGGLLGGYSAGLPRKRWLLRHERACARPAE